MPEINKNHIKTIKVIMDNGEEFEFPAEQHTKISTWLGSMSMTAYNFVERTHNGKKLLAIISTSDDEIMDEVMRLFDESNIDKILNN
jgi:hypothetical protein